MAVFASGKYALAICDRCGQQYKFLQLKKEWNGLQVCPECYESKHPQLEPKDDSADAQALPFTRPARLEPVTVFVGAPGDSVFESSGMQPSQQIKRLVSQLSLGEVTVSTASTTTYTVTVGSKSGGGNAFYIDGVEAPILTLNEGDSYIFNLSDNTVDSHPFYLSTTSDGSHGGGSVYTTGVTFKINGSSVSQSAYASGYSSATTRALEITVASSAPTLYYYCSSHSGMGNSINTP
tara:strand:+ start:2091 stop:2798 length:708 start_codon:yes stop_codon:yes gene_type:complete